MNFVLLARNFDFSDAWLRAAAGVAAIVRIVQEGDLPDEAIAGALVYDPPPGRLSRFPNLKAIFSLSAGVDTVLSDPTLPDVPVVRLVSSDTVALMSEYVVYQVLRIHRSFGRVERLQQERRWVWVPPATPGSYRRITVLGLGRLGLPSARTLQALSFQVSGWSRTPKMVAGIRCFAGQSGLNTLLPETDILVCLLPLTPKTQGLLAADLFSRLPKGASVINASRGGCHIESDLVDALDTGQLAHATLDVFATEPLPSGHPFWRHPQITITPHLAADPPPEACIAEISKNIVRLTRGEPLHGVVDRARGY